MSHKTRKHILQFLTYLLLAGSVSWALFPILWMVSTSIKLPVDYYSDPPVWVPTQPTVQNWVSLFTDLEGAQYFRNSLIVSVGTTVLTLALSIPTAYAIARHRVGGDKFSFWILSQRMLPPVAAVIPLFLLYVRLRLVDTFPGLILAYLIFNIPFAVWILVGFFADFPREIQEQGLVDGCSEFESLWRIVIPVLVPGIVVVGLFCFVFSWNELMFAVTFTRNNTKTLMKLFQSLLQSPTSMSYGAAASAVVLGVVPAYVLTLFFQRYLVRGLTMGGVKG
jgi:multiple sugar transport system permease protein